MFMEEIGKRISVLSKTEKEMPKDPGELDILFSAQLRKKEQKEISKIREDSEQIKNRKDEVLLKNKMRLEKIEADDKLTKEDKKTAEEMALTIALDEMENILK